MMSVVESFKARPQRTAACLMAGALAAAWGRALDAVAGRTIYSLSLLALILATGFGVGASAGEVLGRRMRRPLVAAAVVTAALALYLACQTVLLPGLVGGWERLLVNTNRTFGEYLWALGKTGALLAGVPAVLFGLALRLHILARDASSQAAGGVVAGVSLAAGWLAGRALLPAFGFEDMLRLLALGFAGIVSLAILCEGARARLARAILAALPLAAVAGVTAALPPVRGGTVLSDGIFGRLAHRDSGFALGRPVFCHVARRQVTAAYEDQDYQFVLTVEGRPLLFGNRFHAARTLTAYAPLLARPLCRKAAVVGPDAGVYLPFFPRAGVTNVAVVGAEPSGVRLVLAADAYLTGDETAERLELRWEAALAPDSGYDAILVAPAPGWQRGAAALYSARNLRRYRRALSLDGVLALHVDARALSAARFASIARDFSAVFAGVQVWCVGAQDWVLVGAARAIKAPLDYQLALFDREAVFRDFARAGGLTLADALACVVCDGAGLAGWLASAGAEREGVAVWRMPRAVVEAGRATLQPGDLAACRGGKAEWVLPGQTDADLFVALIDKVARAMDARATAERALAMTASGRGEAGLNLAREAAKLNPRDALLLQSGESLELEGRRRLKLGDMKGALKCYENLLSLGVGTARAHYGIGFCLRGTGDKQNAYLHFARAVAEAPEQTGYRFEMAQAGLEIGEFDEADRQFREVLAREPRNAEALYRFAKGLAMRERPKKDYRQAIELAERACALTRWENKEYAYGLADLYLDAGRVLEGLGLKRRLKEGAMTAPASAR